MKVSALAIKFILASLFMIIGSYFWFSFCVRRGFLATCLSSSSSVYFCSSALYKYLPSGVG